MTTAGMVSPFMKYWIEDEFDGRVKPLVGGVFEEIVKGMEKIGGVIDNGFNAWAFRKVVNELLCEAGVKTIRHALIFGVEFENVNRKRKITSLSCIRIKFNLILNFSHDNLYFANASLFKNWKNTIAVFFPIHPYFFNSLINAVRI